MDLFDLELDAFLEALADDSAMEARLKREVADAYPANPRLPDAVFDYICMGSDMHGYDDTVEDAIDYARRSLPLETAVDVLRRRGKDEIADLVVACVDAGGKWISDGGWVVYSDEGRTVGFIFGASAPLRRLWLRLEPSILPA